MGQLDASVVALALPSLRRDFNASLAAVEWVSLSYLLVLVALVAAVGRFADMAGRKLLYTYGFLLFTAASVGCGLAPGLLALDAFRALQAVGAAMLQANSVALIATAVPADKLGRAIGVQGAAQALGLALGPTVGGLLIAVASWRWIFFLNVPAGIVGVVLAWLLLPRSRRLAPRQPFDWAGLALLLPAVSLLLLVLSLGSRGDIWRPSILALAAAAVALGAGFLGWQRRARFPLLDPALFRRPAFSAGIGSGALSYLVLFGVLFIVPFYLEGARHRSAGTAGLVLTALPFTLGLLAPVAGRLADRLGPRPPTVAGMALAAAALAAMATAHERTWIVTAELAVLGLGLGAFTPANNAAIMAAAPAEQSAVAGGVLNMTRGIGTALGVAVTGAVYGVFAGPAEHPGQVGRGFTAAIVLLATLAGLAAALSTRRHSLHGTAEARCRR